MYPFNTKHLRKKADAFRAKKIEAVRQQDFEGAAYYREVEKKLEARLKPSVLRVKWKLIFELVKIKLYEMNATELYGFFVQSSKESFPVSIEDVYFSVCLHNYFAASCAESNYLAKIWKGEQVNERIRENLVEQATEYFFIRSLLSFLSQSNGSFHLDRTNIKTVLNTNLFLNLFSTPTTKRKPFQNGEYDQNIKSNFALSDEKEILGFYEAFDYTFRYKCSLERENRCLVISTPYFEIKLRIFFSMKNTLLLPLHYSEYYLGFKKNSGHRINAYLKVSLKLRMIFPWNWHYIKTLKELRTELKEAFSAKHYFEKLNWEPIRIQSRIIENLLNK
ncbi:MAG: UvrB/UvrC motif-containing protein [Prolixibacteraceae bacterium]